jgi:hypothetical protein
MTIDTPDNQNDRTILIEYLQRIYEISHNLDKRGRITRGQPPMNPRWVVAQIALEALHKVGAPLIPD